LSTDREQPEVAVETKWVSSSTTLLRDILRDAIRLELLAAEYGTRSFLILAGKRKNIQQVFALRAFRGHPDYPQSKCLLPLPDESSMHRILRLHGGPRFRQRLFESALSTYPEAPLPKTLVVKKLTPLRGFERSSDYQVLAWQIEAAANRETIELGSAEVASNA
jgi:hypothetical protein